MTKPKSPSARLKAQIHIAKKELGLDDDSYRAMLAAVTNKSSCSDMVIGELHQVMEHLKKLGYKPKQHAKYGKRPNPANSTKALMSKVEALLADRGLHWNYAHAMAKRMFKVDKVDWLKADQLWKLVAALEKAKD